jgi:hypothetical protein
VADFERDKQAALAAFPAAAGPVAAKDVRLADGHVSRAKKTAHLASTIVDSAQQPELGDEALLVLEVRPLVEPYRPVYIRALNRATH